MIDFAKMMERTEAVRKVVKEFSDASYANYGSYSYAAGYLESLLVRAMLDISKKDREAILKDSTEQTNKLQKEVDKTTV
jgi:hypothetical protein